MAYKAEYIWVDGTMPTAKLRSKTKVMTDGDTDLPIWGFDGSSTNQAPGDKSDCVLQPVFTCPDPIREYAPVSAANVRNAANTKPCNRAPPDLLSR